MSDYSRIRDVLELEVLLFGGVPEKPEPVYGRDSHAHVQSRTTRTGIAPATMSTEDLQGPVVENFTVNFETGEISYGEYVPPPETLHDEGVSDRPEGDR